MKDKISFSICVTAYNRVNELRRLLESIDSNKHAHDLEIIVSEDKSPKQEEIKKVVLSYADNSCYKVLFNTNDSNLGYDRNLGKLKELASGDFIIYMSDDDAFMPGQLDTYLDYLSEKECPVCFQPFVGESGIRRKYDGNQFYPASEATAAKHIYDSILFSGLTYKRDFIKDIDAEPFLNSNYFQVYMFMTVAYKYGLHYYDSTLVNCIMDGENAYGISESSVKNADLANRKSVFSNIEFNKGLLWVISRFDNENGTECKKVFSDEYSIRTLPGMIRARKEGKDTYREYIRRLEGLDLNLSGKYRFYKFCIGVFGATMTEALFALPKKMLVSYRSHR